MHPIFQNTQLKKKTKSIPNFTKKKKHFQFQFFFYIKTPNLPEKKRITQKHHQFRPLHPPPPTQFTDRLHTHTKTTLASRQERTATDQLQDTRLQTFYYRIPTAKKTKHDHRPLNTNPYKALPANHCKSQLTRKTKTQQQQKNKK